jgi:hypothetical protein
MFTSNRSAGTAVGGRVVAGAALDRRLPLGFVGDGDVMESVKENSVSSTAVGLESRGGLPGEAGDPPAPPSGEKPTTLLFLTSGDD